MGLLPWLCGATRSRGIAGLRRSAGTFPKFDVRHGSKPLTLAVIVN